DAEGLAEALAPQAGILAPIRVPGSGEARITLTAQVLNGALSKHIVITGAEKREALDRAAQLDAMAAPVRAVWTGATVHWAA
ncbi:MAG: 6-phosphogluconolactonase, partial [Pseudomonadota bacterium]